MKKGLSILLIVFALITNQGAISQEYDFPHYRIIGDYESTEYTVMYPIGWSKTGLFAWIHQDVNPLSAAMIFKYDVIIQDLRNNKEIWSQSIEYNAELNPELLDKIDLADDTTLFGYSFFCDYVWNENYDQISKKMKEFEIIQDSVKVRNIPFIHEGWILTEETVTNPDEPGCTVSYTVSLQRQGTKILKVLYQFSQAPNEDNMCTDPYGNSVFYLNFEIRAYFKSPFEDLYVLYIVQSAQGYEEPWEYPFLIGYRHLPANSIDIKSHLDR